MRQQLTYAISVAIMIGVCQQAYAETNAPSALENFNLGGYFSAGVNVHPEGKTNGGIDELGLLLSWDNGSRFRFLSELDIDKPLAFNQNNSSDGISTHFGVDRFYLERIYLDYNLSEKLNLRTGRFLTPAGRWNIGHAAPLVWTTTRPLSTSNRLFPEATNGVMLYGATPLANNAIEYNFYMGVLNDEYTDKKDTLYKDIKGAHIALSGKVNWGLSVLEYREDSPSSPAYRLLGLDFFAQHEGWEFSGEVSQRYNHNYSDGGNGAYLQGVAPLGNQWFAVARIESFKSPAIGSIERLVLGTAWRMKPNRVLKIEYVAGNEQRPDSPKGVLASFAILF